jgi:hypothetical protein
VAFLYVEMVVYIKCEMGIFTAISGHLVHHVFSSLVDVVHTNLMCIMNCFFTFDAGHMALVINKNTYAH